MSGFYVTLPSNVKYLEDKNKIGNYKTKLAKRLIFSDDWEVAITDIIYPKSWYNIRSNQRVAIVQNNGYIYDYQKVVEAGHYNEDDLINIINVKLYKTMFNYYQKDVFKPPFIKYNKYSKTVQFEFGGAHDDEKVILYPVLGDELLQILGFNLSYKQKFDYNLARDKRAQPVDLIIAPTDKEANERILKSERACDLNAGITSLFVYTDIIKPSLVGDTHAQLLRVVPIKNAVFGEIITHNFENPFYFSLNSRDIQVIEIDIKDHTGETITFREGTVTIVLHFRRKNEFL